MFKKLLKNKKAQQTAEYALLISLVVAAVIAMQTYAQRTIQGRIRDASQFLTDQTSALGTSQQYEPYYLKQSYDITRSSKTSELQGINRVGYAGSSNRAREAGGYQSSTYGVTGTGLVSNQL
jgi:Flp pilus assembly pilin Flp